VNRLRSTLDEIGVSVYMKPLDSKLDRFLNDEEFLKDDELVESETLAVSDSGQLRPIELHDGSPKHVYAVDSSSIVLGECKDGTVFSTRGVVVSWDPKLEETKIVHSFEAPCFVSNANKGRLYNDLRRDLWEITEEAHAPDVEKMIDRVRNIYERHLQLQIARQARDSILLYDGSLTGNTVDTPEEILSNIVAEAGRNNNDVVALSKKTRLVTTRGERILDLLETVPGFPSIIPINSLIHIKDPTRIVGDVYVARLSRVPISFRIDVNSKRSCSTVFSDLLRSCFLESGYPKPLINAHIYCYYNSFDVMGVRSYLMKRGVTIREEFDIRKLLFGVYGG
jgi:hypothetical protein